jgi:hypothetical protein
VQSLGRNLPEPLRFSDVFWRLFSVSNAILFALTFAANVYVVGKLVLNEMVARDVLLYEGERDPVRKKNFAYYYDCKNTLLSLKYDHECIREAIAHNPNGFEKFSLTEIEQQTSDLYIAIATINRRATRIF